jgi:hypothetical protein
MPKESSGRRVRIPVTYVSGVWECGFGGGTPVKEGTKGELLIDRRALYDKAFLSRMEQKAKYRILDEGTKLLVILTIKREAPPNDAHREHLWNYHDLKWQIATELLDAFDPSTIHFVEITIGKPDDKQERRFESDKGGLWLLTEGVKAAGLASTTIQLPGGICKDPVTSVNHAYTKLSEIFETWRISHTGNVYSRVLYQEKNNKWYPLEVLRNAALDKKDMAIAEGIWKDFKSKMNL